MHRWNTDESKASLSAQSSDTDFLVTELCDPLESLPFKDPVYGNDGFIYERASILRWMQRKPVSPYTDKPLTLSELPQGIARKFKNIIEECQQQNQQMQDLRRDLANRSQELLKKEEQIAGLQKQIAINQKPTPPPKKLEFKNVDLEPHALNKSFLNSRFLKAVSNHQIEEAKYYLREGADINALNEKGESALIIAMQLRTHYPELALQMIKLFCSLNINVNRKDLQGMTALHYACARNDSKIALFLLTHGANPLIINNASETPRKLGSMLNRNFNPELEDMLKKKENQLQQIISYQSEAMFLTPSVGLFSATIPENLAENEHRDAAAFNPRFDSRI